MDWCGRAYGQSSLRSLHHKAEVLPSGQAGHILYIYNHAMYCPPDGAIKTCLFS